MISNCGETALRSKGSEIICFHDLSRRVISTMRRVIAIESSTLLLKSKKFKLNNKKKSLRNYLIIFPKWSLNELNCLCLKFMVENSSFKVDILKLYDFSSWRFWSRWNCPLLRKWFCRFCYSYVDKGICHFWSAMLCWSSVSTWVPPHHHCGQG